MGVGDAGAGDGHPAGPEVVTVGGSGMAVICMMLSLCSNESDINPILLRGGFSENIRHFRSPDGFSSPRNIRTIRRRQDSPAGRGGRGNEAMLETARSSLLPIFL